MSEIQRLNKLCAERKEAEDSLRKKWKKIEEFDARRSELESIYNALLKASMVGFYTISLSAMHILHSRVICFIESFFLAWGLSVGKCGICLSNISFISY